MTRNELRTALQDTTSETIDAARVYLGGSPNAECTAVSYGGGTAQRSRRELDKLSAESIQLATKPYQRWRHFGKDARRILQQRSGSHRRSSCVPRRKSRQPPPTIRHHNIYGSARRINEERSRALNAALELQGRLQDRLSAQRRIEELTVAEEVANTTRRASQGAVERHALKLRVFVAHRISRSIADAPLP